MKILVADFHRELQDQVHLALEQFEGFEVECAVAEDALDRARRCDHDWIFVQVTEDEDNGRSLLEALVEEPPEASVFVVADKPLLAKLKDQPSRHQVSAYLGTPLEPVEFYRVVARLRNRASAS